MRDKDFLKNLFFRSKCESKYIKILGFLTEILGSSIEILGFSIEILVFSKICDKWLPYVQHIKT